MGRPALTTEVVRVQLTLSLRVGEDNDLIDWFAALPARRKARLVCTALRQGGAAFVQEAETTIEELVDDDAFAAMLGAL